MKSSRSRPANSTTISSRHTRVGGSEKVNGGILPILPWMAGSYCLPESGLCSYGADDSLDRLCKSMFRRVSAYSSRTSTEKDNSFSDHQFDFVVRFKVELEVHLSNYFGTRVMLLARLSNGFGTRSCDVDMSLSFPAGPPRKVLMGGVVCPDYGDCAEVAEALGRLSRTQRDEDSTYLRRRYLLYDSVERTWTSKQILAIVMTWRYITLNFCASTANGTRIVCQHLEYG
ncbi:hypothetical protein COOONC_27982 [Cooperia oncophora]